MHAPLFTMKYIAITALILMTLTREAHAVRTIVTALTLGLRSISG